MPWVDPEEVRRVYGRLGRLGMYDFLLRLGRLGEQSNTREKLAARLRLQRGDRVLDIGCGTGLNFQALRAQAGDAGVVVGLDLTPEMLERARARVLRRRWINVDLVEGDATALPFEDGSFSAVCSGLALSGLPDWQAAMAEAWRVLRPGGHLAILEAAPIAGFWRPAAPPLQVIYRYVFAAEPPSPDPRRALHSLDPAMGTEAAFGGLWRIIWASKA